MREGWDTASGRRVARVLKWAEGLLLAMGAMALGWCAFAAADAQWSQRSARQSLDELRQANTSTAVPPRPDVPRGTPLAELSIPRIHLSAVVLHGSDAGTLRLGLGHIEHTAMPGGSGNVAIAGHRDSFFRSLRDVQVGDDILLDTPQERWHYRVTSLKVVRSTEVSVLKSTADPTLTLVTCYPFWFIGPAPDRLVVRATRIAEPTAAALAISARGPTEPIPAPVRERVATPPKVRGASDDGVLVRQAIERFQFRYNARVPRRGEVRSVGPLTFEACSAVLIGHDSATGTCQIAAQSSEGLQPLAWTFTLDRAGDDWAIKSVAAQ